MQTKSIKHKHHRSHPVRLSAVAIALATGFHVSGMAHYAHNSGHRETFATVMRGYMNQLERENETARHAVRFDECLRLPSISGDA